MALVISDKTVQVSTDPSGVFDVTMPGLENPIGAMLFLSGATTANTIAADSMMSIGFVDGTSQHVVSIHNKDGQLSANTDRNRKTDCCVMAATESSVLDGKLSFNSWITTGEKGIRLNINEQMGQAYLLTVLFFTGDGMLSAEVFSRDLQSSTAPQNFTGLSSGTPDVLMLAHNYTSSASAFVHSPLSFGMVINDNPATPTQKSIGWCGDNGASVGDQNTFASNNAALCAPLIGANRFNLTISDLVSNGFTHTCSGSTGTDIIGIALRFESGTQFALKDMSIPVTGNYVKTGFGFTPEFGLFANVIGPTAFNTLYTGSNSGAFSLTTFNGSTVHTNTITDKDSSLETVCKSLSSDQFRILHSDGVTDAVLASTHTIDADGWTFPLTKNPTSPILGFEFAIGKSNSGTEGILLAQESGPDTTTFTGEVLVEGDLASTDGSDTSTMSGEVLVAGGLSSQESGNDTATFAGGNSIAGDLSAQESGSDTANLSGEVLVDGALSSTESYSDTTSFSGEVLVDGDLVTVGEGSDTATFSGEVPVEGDFSSSESGADTITLSGEIPVSGTFSIVESGSDVISLNGGSIIVGTMSSVEAGSDTLTMTGEVPSQGILSSIEAGSDSSIFSGELPISGTMNTVENGTDGVSVTGNVYIKGTLFISEQPDTASMSGEVLVSGTLSVVESGSDSILFSGLEVTRTISKLELEVLKAEVESLNILGKTQIVLYPI